MEDTKTSIRNLGRILPYEEADPNESLVDFKRRILEQVKVIRIAIKSDDVNDPEAAENYAKKAERFVEIPFFKGKSGRVRQLKAHLKETVGESKELIGCLKEWLKKKKERKVIFTEAYLKTCKTQPFDYKEALIQFYDQDLEYLSQTVIPQFQSETILISNLIDIFKSKKVMDEIGAKNSWKVTTFKLALIEYNKTTPFDERFSFDDIMNLPYFRYKRYLNLTLEEFKNLLFVRYNVLIYVIVNLSERYHEIETLKEDVNSRDTRKTVKDMLMVYDRFFEKYKSMLNELEKKYSLYRFGQGLIEADIFKSLFK